MILELGFLKDAVEMERNGDLRNSLAVIYRRIEELSRDPASLDFLNEELTSISPDEIGTDVLLGLLTATLPVKRKLPSRPALFRSTLRILQERGDFEPGLLDGLQ